MEVVKTFGDIVTKLGANHPYWARQLLKTGWEAQDLKLRWAPERRLTPANRYLAHIMMQCMLWPLKTPGDSVLVSIFTPCELLREVGLHPYNVEGFSSYLAGSRAERSFLQKSEDLGLSETLCSYHKTFIGAAFSKLMPRPKCIVYTNIACDANLLTFKKMADFYGVPSFMIDVGADQSRENVLYVADELHDLADFLEKYTAKKIDPSSLSKRVKMSFETLLSYEAYEKERADKYVPEDIVSPLYAGIANNILLGTIEEARYVQMLHDDLKKAPSARGTRIYWMHTIPFWSNAVKDVFLFNENAQIVGCELAQPTDLSRYSEDPYEAMALRLVYHYLNGSVTRRIDAGIRHALATKADGAIWFNHWGCKHTLGGSILAQKKFDEAGLPLLILDGDGCDISHGGEGQTATRLGAFMEMLKK